MKETAQAPGLVVEPGRVLRRRLDDLQVVPGPVPVEPPGQDELCGERDEKEDEERRPGPDAGEGNDRFRPRIGSQGARRALGPETQALRSRKGTTLAKRPATARASRRAAATVPSRAAIR